MNDSVFDGTQLGENGLYIVDNHNIECDATNPYTYMDLDYASALLSPRTLDTFAQTASP